MRELGGCKIYGPNDHTEHHVGDEDSSCFYYAPYDLGPLAESLPEKECFAELPELKLRTEMKIFTLMTA